MVMGMRQFELNPYRIEMDREQVSKKWTGQLGVDRVFPRGQESIGIPAEKVLMMLCRDPVCEVGCGTGRIAKLFNGRKYFGIDINAEAIEKAKRYSAYDKFKTITWDDPYPKAKTYLFYTVLLHIPDNEIEAIIAKTNNRVVVAEPMNRWIREYGLSNNFQRNPDEYRILFKNHGMEERAFYHVRLPYFPYYIHMGVYSCD
jgi:SAM-dependent methyltransferase